MAEAYNPIEELMFGGMNLTEGAFPYLGGEYKNPFQGSRLSGSDLEKWYNAMQAARSTVRAYHGTNTPKDIDRFQLPMRSEEQGVFFTPDPATAGRYAGAAQWPGGYSKPAGKWTAPKGGSVYPVDIDLTNSYVVNAKGKNYGEFDVDNYMKAAKKAGYDHLVITNMEDVGGSHPQIISLNPAGKVKSATTGATLFSALSALFGGVRPKKRNDE